MRELFSFFCRAGKGNKGFASLNLEHRQHPDPHLGHQRFPTLALLAAFLIGVLAWFDSYDVLDKIKYPTRRYFILQSG